MSETTIGPGRKDDGSKVRVDLLPVRALLEIAKVMTFGAAKYGANNWQNVTPRRRYYGAALRHLWARALGEKTDPESGLPHLAHAGCCVVFMLSAEVGFDPVDAFEPTVEEPIVTDATFSLNERPLRKTRGTLPRKPEIGDRVFVEPKLIDGRSRGRDGGEGDLLEIDEEDSDLPFYVCINGRSRWYWFDEVSLVKASGAV